MQESVSIVSLLTGIVTGLCSGVSVYAAIRVHITWIIKTLENHDKRITRLEGSKRATSAFSHNA